MIEGGHSLELLMCKRLGIWIRLCSSINRLILFRRWDHHGGFLLS